MLQLTENKQEQPVLIATKRDMRFCARRFQAVRCTLASLSATARITAMLRARFDEGGTHCGIESFVVECKTPEKIGGAQ